MAIKFKTSIDKQGVFRLYYQVYIYKIIKKILTVSVILCLAASVFVISACKVEDYCEIYLLGSPVTFYFMDGGYQEGSKQDKKLRAELSALADRLNGVFSVENQSEVSAFNAAKIGETISVGKDFYDVSVVAQNLYALTDGNVNPSCKLLVDLWGFSKRYRDVGYCKEKPFDRDILSGGGFPLPDSNYVNGFLALTDYSRITVQSNGGYTITKPELFCTVYGEAYTVELDYAAFVKGYYCDLAKSVINSYGVKDYYVSAGGSSLYLTEKFGGDWGLLVVDPFSPAKNNLLSVNVRNSFVSTSGTYQNYYTLEDKNYCHIIDGKTGCPTQSDLVSATVICNSGIVSDGISTALINMGEDAALKFLKSGAITADYILVSSDGRVITNISEKITYLKKQDD